MDTVKYGIIGLGFFGDKHAEVLSSLPGVELAAVCTRRENRLKEIAETYSVPNAYTDYNELLANKDIDAVSIVTHAKDHLAPTIAALKAGKHVFLEKPMALSVAECDQILAEVEKSPKCFMVGHICRFAHRYALAKKQIESGNIGKIVSIYARRNISVELSRNALNTLSSLAGDGIHDTDIMLWLTGANVKSVYAATASSRELPNPDIGWAVYNFDTGAIGVIESTWCLPANTPYAIDDRMEIIGDKGTIQIKDNGPMLAINNSQGVRYLDTSYWPYVHGLRSGALREELAYFADCVRTGTKPDVIKPWESRKAVEVIEAAETSAKTGKVVVL